MHKFYFFILLIGLNSTLLTAQEIFPGGVPGAEAWYIATPNDNETTTHQNHGTPHIAINSCYEEIGEPFLFNFNPSFMAGRLCLKYKAALENTTSRNVFFVGEPKQDQSFSHVTTSWNETLNPMPTSTVRNRFDLSTDAVLAGQQSMVHQSFSNANVNFYNWNVYQTDRRFKSYGLDGETNFYIGREFQNDTIEAKSFQGNFPEFISFPFELTANQRNRVDSYLALKYGITLKFDINYRASNNVIFWKKANSKIFPERIFGLGRDNISGLHQLISESVHEKDLLVASVGEWAETNEIKQQSFRMRDGNFIVYGDNNKKLSVYEGYHGQIKRIERIWLSQNTGDDAANYEIDFKFNIEGNLKNRLIEDPSQKIWMMRDKYAGNQTESGFQGNGIDYYPAVDIQGNTQYAIFRSILFDKDSSVHDQFTFGIGPEMIVIVEFPPFPCDIKSSQVTIRVIGGTAPYKLLVEGPNGLEEFEMTSDTMDYEAYMFTTYTITAIDANGSTAVTTLDMNVPQIEVDLGPDLVLDPSQLPLTLDASTNVYDSEATYAWYVDGVQLEHYDATLDVTQTGEYTVIITAGNRVCQMTDSIIVYRDFRGSIDSPTDCNLQAGAMSVNLSGGTAPYTTVIVGPLQTLNLVHNNEALSLTELEFGQYTVTSTDSNGLQFSDNIQLSHPMGAPLNLLSQMTQNCSGDSYYEPSIGSNLYTCAAPGFISMDASNPYLTYDWYIDNDYTGVTSPTIEIADHPNLTDNHFPIIKVVVTNAMTGCTQEESIIVKGQFVIYDANVAGKPTNNVVAEGSQTGKFLKAIVYPNPSLQGEQFQYQVSSDEVFEGTVEIYNPLGAILMQVPISNQSQYDLSFSLPTSGMYLILTRTNGKILTNKIVIK